jgi:hypothetical protein
MAHRQLEQARRNEPTMSAKLKLVAEATEDEAFIELQRARERFIRRTRNPDLPRPVRFEPTVKAPGDVVI